MLLLRPNKAMDHINWGLVYILQKRQHLMAEQLAQRNINSQHWALGQGLVN